MLYELHVLAHVSVILFLGGVIYWIRESGEGEAASWLIRLLLLDVLWVTVLLAQLLAPLPWKKWIYPVGTGVATITPVVWFVFSLYYTGREQWFTPARKLVLGAIPVATFLLLSTNNVHSLLWTEYSVMEEPFVYLVAKDTAFQWVVFVGVYVFALGGLLVLVDFIFSTRHLSRTQVGTIIGAGAVAIGINLLSTLGIGLASGFDYSGLASGIFGAAIGWALFNERLFLVAPVARDSIFASFSDPLIAVDLNGTVVDFNAAAVETFPAIEAHVGNSLSTLEPRLLDEESESGFAETVSLDRDGRHKSFRIEHSPIDAGTRQVGVVLHLRDVTELESYAEELERRTGQLETKTEQLEQFASSASHDLRNPINVAKGRIEIAKETGDLTHLETAADALDRGLETIDQLLDLARSGKTIGEPTAVDLGSVVDDAWDAVETGPATLTTDIDGRTLQADRGRLQGLFENLFRNALEHGGSEVAVTVETVEDGFVVSDDGPGIPEGERDKVFDHGYTGGDGTGLGLAKVEAIAIAHDWSVTVGESESGGAAFRFETAS